jgi:ATP synthase protein I
LVSGSPAGDRADLALDPVASEPSDTPPSTSPAAAAADPAAASAAVNGGLDDYRRLQQRLLLATVIVSAAAVAFTAWRFDLPTAGSLLVGALAGLLYLWLLARSVSKLGNGSKKVGKIQLLVPVVLVLASSRSPQLELLPALIGFVLYKPALLLQALFDR